MAKVGRPRKTVKTATGEQVKRDRASIKAMLLLKEMEDDVIPETVYIMTKVITRLEKSIRNMRIAIWVILAGLALLAFAHIQLVNQLVAIINTVK